jgi:thioredoxin 1
MIEIVENGISVCKDKDCHLLFYFTAKWCGPCQKIKPILQKLSEGADSTKLEIYMVDIDENDDLANEFNIKSVPTFYLYHKNKLKGETTGADINKVQELLNLIN